jgi:Fur family ferric uptake transcriptional regulator
MSRSNYQTTNKKKILDYIKKQDSSFTTKNLYQEMKKEKEDVGLTTIYRFLEELEKQEQIKKYYNSKNIAYYQYLDPCSHENHFYLKCSECGNLIHIDCDCIIDLEKHIQKKHHFKMDNKNIVITGYCSNCRGE